MTPVVFCRARSWHGILKLKKTMLTIPKDKPFLSLKEAATCIARSVKTVRRLIDEGQISAHRLRSRWVIKPENLETFVQSLPTNF